MTKKLEEMFDLDPIEEQEENELTTPIEQANTPIPADTIKNIDKIESALPTVKGLEASDQEMDELGQLAQDSYKDLMDLGMNVDSRFASEIFGVASGMLGHAITAKTAKINKKLKMIDLQLKKAQLDQREKQMAHKKGEEIETGEGHILDRNELLEQLLKNKGSNE